MIERKQKKKRMKYDRNKEAIDTERSLIKINPWTTWLGWVSPLWQEANAIRGDLKNEMKIT